MKLTCQFCGELLDLGGVEGAVVAHCHQKNASCSLKQWGSAGTRFNYADPRDRAEKPTHIIQTNPPEEDNATAAFLERVQRGPTLTEYLDGRD